MPRTSTVSAMVRSSGGVIIATGIVVLLVVLPGTNPSAYALEREATVELLPNDLVSEDRETDTANKVIATPAQVIEHQVSKTWRTIVRKMLDETRTSVKQKRMLPSGTLGGIEFIIALFVMFCKAGLIQLPIAPLDGGSRSNPVLPITNPVSGNDMLKGDILHSITDTGSLPGIAAVHPDTSVVSQYAEGDLLSGAGVSNVQHQVDSIPHVDVPHAAVPPVHTPDLAPTKLGGVAGKYGL
ncbi:uncharacterized protein LOC118513858 [Anopheles stephensi]|uniref:uncharacterized protein LOC118513858 n=1 Tax=Anopheles stephensi TaxID=30069 RepID=UPI001658C0A5|nr:uncharacterized protein LOC118513858 [Anopheles stephensi]